LKSCRQRERERERERGGEEEEREIKKGSRHRVSL